MPQADEDEEEIELKSHPKQYSAFDDPNFNLENVGNPTFIY